MTEGARHVSVSVSDAFGLTNLWRGQRRLLGTRRPEVLYIGGLGASKSFGLALKGIQLATLNQGRQSWVVAQTVLGLKQNLLPTTLTLLQAFRDRMAFSLETKALEGNEPLIRYRGGGQQHWMGEVAACRNRGPSLSHAIVDEGTKLHDWQATYEAVLGRVRGAARLRQIIMASNMDHGESGLIAEWVRRCEQGDPDVDLIVSPTWENQALNDNYIASQVKGLSRTRVAALICALLLRPQAAMWPEFDDAQHVIEWDPLRDGVRRWTGKGPPTPLPWGVSCDWGSRPSCGVWQRGAVDREYRIHHPDAAPRDARQCLIRIDEDAGDHGGDPRTKQAFGRLIERWREAFRADPVFAASDRNNPKMNHWLGEAVGYQAQRWYAVKKADQEVGPGLELVRELLDPLEGPPALFFAQRLVTLSGSGERGSIASMRGYKRRMAGGEFTPEPMQDNIFEHAADEIRYACVAQLEYRGERFGG